MIEAGADMLYAERFGVSDAAKEKGVLAIGNVIDTQADYPDTVIASAIWHFEPTFDKAVERCWRAPSRPPITGSTAT
jgi:basic membrane protein A and related proteins